MKKLLSHLPNHTLLLLFIMLILVLPQVAHAQALDLVLGALTKLLQPASWVAGALGWIASAVSWITEWLTWLSGVLLNYVIQYTVVDMKENLEKAGAVNKAWQTIRDLGNMGFIFVLLYAAIETILGRGDNKKLVVNIVVVAIMVNFSLFLTKIVIDISNVLAVTFYDAIAPGALRDGLNGGLSNSLMEPLRIQSVWNAKGSITGYGILVAGVMSTIVSLIAAFIFFAVAILFIIRFVILIFVIILSPLAFLAMVMPQLNDYGKKWWKALSGQAFFAPIYFMLTWIVIVVARGILPNSGSMAAAIGGVVEGGKPPTADAVGVFMNYIIMIAMLIISLVLAKDWAGKTPSGFGKLASAATGWAGGLTLGAAGSLGRGTLGRVGAGLASSGAVKNMVDRGGMAGAAGRLAMLAGNKSAKSSWDIRATGLSSQLGAGKAKKGGFFADEKARQKTAAERAKAQEATPDEKRRLQNIEDKAREEALRKAGYARPQALTDAERAVAQANQRRQGENQRAFEQRQRQAREILEREGAKDQAERQRIVEADENVKRAIQNRQNAENRPVNYATRMSQPIVKIPRIDERGIGGTLGEAVREKGQELSARGRRRTGGFLDAVGRVLALRQAERDIIAEKARKYEETIKKAKSDELSEKVKKAIERDEEESKPKPETPPPAAAT